MVTIDNPSRLNSGDPSTTAGPQGKQHWETNDNFEIVTVEIFNREYRFKSNRPELVREIAELINRLTAEVNVSLPGMPHLTDCPAHVAFSLARDLIKSRLELEQLKAFQQQVDEKISHLTASIDLGLEA
ncbi:MAG: cell division protein ZapA [Deltaproteobacteria bacterium]|jgi:cell division protein ZapA (FtsZ GTPase activity inhibitor)|nr:cell division protein ZapA [Deltaproteobacteria bacterium]